MTSSTISTVERRTLPAWFYSGEASSTSPDTSQNAELVEAENDTRSPHENDVGTSDVSVGAENPETFNDHAIDSTSESNPAAPSDVRIASPDSSLIDNIPTSVDSVCDNPGSSSPSDDVTTSSSDTPPPKRIPCCFGTACYRQNVQHKAEFSHPGDEDYEPEEAQCSSSTDVNGNKPACWYGKRCYRKNAEHLEAFSHDFTSSGRPKRTTRTRVEREPDSDDDDSDELDDFDDTDEYEASFIDDNDSSEDFESDDETASEISDNDNAPEDEEDSSKKRKKKTKNTKKKKKKETLS